jgi:multifunctional methyltransferase subunit TRM112
MRLLTHNYLQSNVKGTEKGYPLTIEATKIELEISPCNIEFIETLLPKIDYNALLNARNQIVDRCLADLGSDFTLPDLPASIENGSGSGDGNSGSDNDGSGSGTKMNVDAELMKKLHTILLDIHIVEGHLICPDTGRRFKISNGIPNMILHEDEI